MAAPFVMSMQFRGDGANLKAAAAEARKDVASVSDAAEKAVPGLDRHTEALKREAQANREAAEAARDLGRAEKTASDAAGRAAGSPAIAARPGTPAIVPQQLPLGLSGIVVPGGRGGSAVAFSAADRDQATLLRAATAGFAEARAESQLYRAELDAVRAQYDPLFAASRRYEQELREIAAAEQMGAISAQRAAAARADAAARMAPANLPSAPPAPSGPAPDHVDAVRATYLPLYRAQRDYERELGAVRQAEAEGILSAEESAQVQTRLGEGYERTVEMVRRSDPAFRAAGGAMKLQAYEARNLTYQLNDVFQTLLLGMPPQQVLLQQGPQITQIFGGVGNTFRALTSVLTPMRLGLGLTAGAALVGVSAWNSYLKSTKEVETASQGLGRAVTAPAAELEASARAGAAAAGISVASARSMQAQFLRTGRVGAENYAELIGISKDFAATMGISSSAAGEALAEMFADPAKAADELLNKYGLIDADRPARRQPRGAEPAGRGAGGAPRCAARSLGARHGCDDGPRPRLAGRGHRRQRCLQLDRRDHRSGGERSHAR